MTDGPQYETWVNTMAGRLYLAEKKICRGRIKQWLNRNSLTSLHAQGSYLFYVQIQHWVEEDLTKRPSIA